MVETITILLGIGIGGIIGIILSKLIDDAIERNLDQHYPDPFRREYIKYLLEKKVSKK